MEVFSSLESVAQVRTGLCAASACCGHRCHEFALSCVLTHLVRLYPSTNTEVGKVFPCKFS